ncbi:bacillithiol system redox-active protein YtxJ [Virgibacillus sp. DJP39]|uniref:bacillithiol system redox-active protein YtxJ n=1 Tax=Virgibacillus sp. DJP39 TaxID=3409790 RepID=UPI003BB73C54
MNQMQEIDNREDWDQIFQDSTKNPVLVFKHSTTCPISAKAFQEYTSYVEANEESVNNYLVKVIESREVSNQIQNDTNIKHESPQLFLIKDQEVVWHTSHGKITKGNIEDTISSKLV